MVRCRISTTIISILAIAMAGGGQADPPTTSRPTGESSPMSRAEREKHFKKMLTGAVLTGTWQMTGPDGLEGKAPLGEPKTDRYTISRVSKGSDDWWVISARVQYADKDVTIPITVQVVWAGDTPVITLDKMALPGLGMYSARVMIYRGFYSGTWFGTNYGGVLSGQITRPDAKAPGATTRPGRGE